MLDTLQKFAFFKGLSTEEMLHFIENTHFQTRKYLENEIIYYSGAKCDSLNLLVEGEVRGELFGENGKTIIVDIIEPNNTFAEAFLFSSEAIFYVNVIAAKPSKILSIDKESFLKSLCLSKLLLQNYLTQVSDRLVTLTKRIRTFSLLTIEAKIANLVLEKEKYCKNQKVIDCELTHEQMADYFGVSRPALSRKLAELKNNNIVEFARGRIKIIDRGKLLGLLNKEKTTN